MGPCLCGDPYCSRCFGAGAVHDPPETCPVCDGPNADPETGDVFEATYDTCGKPECVATAKARKEALDRADHEADLAQQAAAEEWEKSNAVSREG